ncbi:YheT family hydrolase [Oceanicoccus sagamiensis]|uniref:AB hydrolase-1 domain-containing protein n=1 Tax=Oceanicoccus sagamiensis TaxID=716816 RepID=A0A1X9NIJ1_9GAMM|nr:alpha/beta fold hydrolase [Oceanicoccus sagamiensis]ARN74707.1 hypothetical protein BST96_11590 [Oceanicoccus sagamiensis]
MDTFKPSALLKNPHLQSILASTGPRKHWVKRQAKTLRETASQHILDCGDGIRLQGEYSTLPNNQQGLVILIHGWLGSNDSLYLLSAGSTLLAAGYNVFRLNLRDHGDSGHLNRELFNSTRITEVVNAVKAIQQQFPHTQNYLAGFSLGGNFSLRVAARAPANAITLNKVVAVCPVINPYKTNRNLNNGPFIYHQHFRNHWRQSLANKLQHFPEHGYQDILNKLPTLDAMNDYFVPHHTAYAEVDDYLNGYSIGGEHLSQLEIPCHILSSMDDPVIEAEDLQELPDHPQLTIELTRYGGHCGYIQGLTMDSWADQRILELFAESTSS